MNVQVKSKAKIVSLIACILLIFFIGNIIIWLGQSQFMSLRITITMITIVIFPIYISRINPQFKQVFRIKKDSFYFEHCYDLIHNPPIDVEIMCNEIIKLSYKGTKIIPMSEMMVISTENEKIYIDFNFKNYLKLWRDIVNTCEKNSPHVEIDQRLYKRLKKLETK